MSKIMHAAVVGAWGSPPCYQKFTLPALLTNQVTIKVLATGLHNLVRSRAAGKHYTVANTSPPHIPGIDGVGQIQGTTQMVYFVAMKPGAGSFAEYVNVDKEDTFPVPSNVNAPSLAALMNPAMSSWMALTARANIEQQTSFSVAILGATGVSGRAAVQISKALGASRVVAIGRNKEALAQTKSLGADATIELEDNATTIDYSEAADVDVVLDYLYGDVASTAMLAIVKKRKNKSQRLVWVAIGNMAGAVMPLDGPLLRAANVFVCGCGPGSWTFTEFGKEMPKLLAAIVKNKLEQEHKLCKLADVEVAWTSGGKERLVFEP